MGSGLLTPTHVLLVAAAVLLVFGPKRLPELGRSLGTGLRGFRETLETGKQPEPSESREEAQLER